jgi:hypothetical protein
MRLRPLAPVAFVGLSASFVACSSSSGTVTGDAAVHSSQSSSGHETSSSSSSSPSSSSHVETSSHLDAGHDARHEAGKPDVSAGDAVSDAPVVTDVGGPTDAGKPPDPSGSKTTSVTPITFAIHHLWLGDSLPEPSFPPDTTGTAWSQFGYNIDGLITNASSTDVCTLAAGATTAIQLDGVGGIDNSFGENIVPFLASAVSNLSQTVSSSIIGGDFTVLIDTTGLTSSPTQTNTGLTGGILSAASYGGTPPVNDAGSFLPTDEWPVYSGSLKGSLEAGAALSFPSAYVTNGLWVNGTPGDITLTLVLQGQPLVLLIHDAVVSFTHTIDASGQDHATGGAISGVLKASEFLAEINIVAENQQYCAEAGLLLGFIAKSADILHDGTNVKGQPCDGISIGLAFDADGVAAPAKVVQSVDAGAQKGCVADAGG